MGIGVFEQASKPPHLAAVVIALLVGKLVAVVLEATATA
jgi:hypothetical protein